MNSIMVFLTYDHNTMWPLVAFLILTGVIGALVVAGWELCRAIKRRLHGADDK